MADPRSPFFGWVKRNKARLFLVALLVAVLSGLNGGCLAHRTGEQLTAEEQRILHEPPLPFSVAVVPWTVDASRQKRRQRGKNRLAYATALVERLENAGAFESVILDTTGTASVDLLAESSGFYCNSAIIPLWSILTLGLYPTTWDEKDCVGVKFRPGNDFANTYTVPVFVSYSQESRTVMGLLAIPLGMLPGWANGEMREQQGYNDRFRLTILEQRDVIEKAAHLDLETPIVKSITTVP